MSKTLLATIAFSVLGLALPAGAQVESKCLSSQLKAGGALAAAQAKCESKAAAKGEAVDPECLAKAAAKAVKALDKAEGKDDCIVTDPAVDAVVDDFVQELLDTLNPPPVICCSNGITCFYAADAPACAGAPLSAAAGAEGSVCTGNGTCAPPPAAAGGCCEDATVSGVPLDCLGGTFSALDCGGAGGTFSTAICTPSGSCQ